MKRILQIYKLSFNISLAKPELARVRTDCANQSLSPGNRFFGALQPGTSRCWRCGHEHSGGAQFFCAQCDTIQEPSDDQNFFRLMGLENNTFDVNNRHLEQTYRALQFRLHPDKFGLGSKEERAYSEEASSLVNKAYNVLRSPLQRASYMLSQQGADADDEEATITDPDYLMEVMEAREAVDAADPQTLQSLQQDYKHDEEECVKDLSGAFARGDYTAARSSLVRLRYIRRILDAIQEKM